ncbi:MAG: hypothetical protein WD073_03850 [Xanthobacteraceae bacterium]
MQPDPFVERLAKIRQRFACTLAHKIDGAQEALPRLSGGDAAAVTLVADTYQQIHSISGVGATVGFAATGRAARGAEEFLVSAYREKRALTSEEAKSLQGALAALKAEAELELRSMNCSGG